ncbi:MAG: tRNA dihydrouridine synthase DusB [Pseudomonadota bacterium]
MQIGPYTLSSPLILAPMAGVTDLPFRKRCLAFGAGMAVSEMMSSDPQLAHTRKSLLRSRHDAESEPRSVQILGADPGQMAEAARRNVDQGAQIIDINMGCPAKKVCKVAAGSALLRDEALVGRILEAVVRAVTVPVTLKIRTGWSPEQNNALQIAHIAEHAGIQALAVHGRSRSCGFSGTAEYTTIATLKAATRIPVIANGDIDSADKALQVLEMTGADALMIGRAALGAPWLFRDILDRMRGHTPSPSPASVCLLDYVRSHVAELHAFYGEYQGLRIARKHIGWYFQQSGLQHRHRLEAIYSATDAGQQLALLDGLFET